MGTCSNYLLKINSNKKCIATPTRHEVHNKETVMSKWADLAKTTGHVNTKTSIRSDCS